MPFLETGLKSNGCLPVSPSYNGPLCRKTWHARQLLLERGLFNCSFNIGKLIY